jgi:hypothetical protein
MSIRYAVSLTENIVDTKATPLDSCCTLLLNSYSPQNALDASASTSLALANGLLHSKV